MRGTPDLQMAMSVVSPGDLIPENHPIRRIKPVVDEVLRGLTPQLDGMYDASSGRRSVPPEHLLKASVLMAMYSIRSERQFCERVRYDLLFKWFLDLNVEDAGFDHSTFSKNRHRLLKHRIADQFFAAVVEQAQLRRYLSGEHFSVDGTLLEAWASHKSFKPKDDDRSDPPAPGRNAEVDFHGEKRSNETHRSTTDPEARMARKGNAVAAKLSYAGHLLMENRNALIRDMELSPATGYAERETALELLRRLPGMQRRRTVAADKGYDTRDFVAECRELGVTPHVAQNTNRRRSAIDGRTTRHPGHAVGLRIRKRIEEPFGWMKTVAGGRKLRYVGLERNRAWFLMTGAVYNLIRIAALDAQQA
jgi:transposase